MSVLSPEVLIVTTLHHLKLSSIALEPIYFVNIVCHLYEALGNYLDITDLIPWESLYSLCTASYAYSANHLLTDNLVSIHALLSLIFYVM